MIGKGANGKNVFIGILSNLHGLKNVSNVSLKSLVKEQFALVDLVNKDINVDSESTSINDISTLKKLTDNQPVRVQQKGQPAFDAKLLQNKFLMPTNYRLLPMILMPDYRREIINRFS